MHPTFVRPDYTPVHVTTTAHAILDFVTVQLYTVTNSALVRIIWSKMASKVIGCMVPMERHGRLVFGCFWSFTSWCILMRPIREWEPSTENSPFLCTENPYYHFVGRNSYCSPLAPLPGPGGGAA